LVQGINAHHLELTEHGKTVERHRGADTRNYRVEVVKRPLAVIESRLARGDVDRHTERIDDLDVVPAGARRLDDAAVTIEMGIARKQGDLHWDSLEKARLLAQQFARPSRRRPPRTCAKKIGAAGLDQRAALKRSAAKQHAEAHLVAIGEWIDQACSPSLSN